MQQTCVFRFGTGYPNWNQVIDASDGDMMGHRLAGLGLLRKSGGERVLRNWATRHLGPRARVWLRNIVRDLPSPRWGNLRRLRPFSESYGFERGTPIDRYYLHRFLEQHRHLITGRVLEIEAPAYTSEYGHDLTATDSVNIVAGTYARLTYLIDLAQSEGVIPDDSYDCFLLPNTLCVLRDIEGCLRNALRVVKPGGVILASTGTFVPLTGAGDDYWRLSAEGWRELASRTWPGCEVSIEHHGNCLTAVAAMLGLAFEELESTELEYHDPRFPVLVTFYCRKPLSAA